MSDDDHQPAPANCGAEDDGTSSSTSYPDLDTLLGLANASRVAPSALSDDFDPEKPTTEQRRVMDASKKSLLPLLLHLAQRPGIQVVGTSNWHQVDVLQFGTGPEFSTRFPLVVYYDPAKPADAPRFPKDADEYSDALTSRNLRSKWHTLSIWVEHGYALIRWDLTHQSFTWYRSAMAAAGPLVFGLGTRGRAAQSAAATAVAASGDAASGVAPTSPLPDSACSGGCGEFDVHGILPCGRCVDYRCAICGNGPRVAGEAVRPPGQAAVAWHPCPHGPAPTSAAAASAGRVIADDDVPPPPPTAAVSPPPARPPADGPSANPAPAASTPADGSPPQTQPAAPAAPQAADADDAGEHHTDDAAADAASDSSSSTASDTETEPTAPVIPDDPAAAGVAGGAGLTSTESASAPPAVDGGPRGDAHPEDRPPLQPAGPRTGLPKMPVCLRQVPLRFTVPAGLIDAALSRLVPEPDAALKDWRSPRTWESDDVVSPTSTKSAVISDQELRGLAEVVDTIQTLVASAMKCAWGAIDLTEVRVLRHENLDSVSARQNLCRRSAGAAKRHLAARILLWSRPGVRIRHSQAPDPAIELVAAGDAIVWWTVIGGCPWWGDDEFAAVESTAVGDPVQRDIAPAIERRYAVELFLFWTRDTRQKRAPGIGKATAIGRGPYSITDPTVTEALFGRPTLPRPLPQSGSILDFLAEHVYDLTSVTHISLPLDPARKWLKVIISARNGRPEEQITFPLRPLIADGDLLVHFAGPTTDDKVTIYVKRPPPPPRAPAEPRPKRLRSESLSSRGSIISIGSAPPRRSSGLVQVARPARKRVAPTPSSAAKPTVAVPPQTPASPREDFAQTAAIMSDALVKVVAAVQAPHHAASEDSQLRQRLEDQTKAAEAKAVAASAELLVAKSEVERTKAENERLRFDLGVSEKMVAELRVQLVEKQTLLKAALDAAETARAEASAANAHIRMQAIHSATAGPAYAAQMMGMNASAIIEATGRSMQFPAIPAPPSIVMFPQPPTGL